VEPLNCSLLIEVIGLELLIRTVGSKSLDRILWIKAFALESLDQNLLIEVFGLESFNWNPWIEVFGSKPLHWSLWTNFFSYERFSRSNSIGIFKFNPLDHNLTIKVLLL
jgi:hypothetical protein